MRHLIYVMGVILLILIFNLSTAEAAKDLKLKNETIDLATHESSKQGLSNPMAEYFVVQFATTIQKEDIHEDEIPEEEVKDIVRKIIKGEIPPDFRPFNHGELCPPNCGGDIVDDNT